MENGDAASGSDDGGQEMTSVDLSSSPPVSVRQHFIPRLVGSSRLEARMGLLRLFGVERNAA